MTAYQFLSYVIVPAVVILIWAYVFLMFRLDKKHYDECTTTAVEVDPDKHMKDLEEEANYHTTENFQPVVMIQTYVWYDAATDVLLESVVSEIDLSKSGFFYIGEL